MTVEHYIVFIGAGASLATELSSLERRFSNSCVVAPAVGRKHLGNTEVAVSKASELLFDMLSTEKVPSQQARLYVLMYEPASGRELDLVWNAFGHASWVEAIPTMYLHKIVPTREYVQMKINEIRTLLHEISTSSYARRKTSPLILPLRNFSSRITDELRVYWYNGLSREELSRRITRFKNRYAQVKDKTRNGFRDDKSLIFKPAEDNECHGQPHPIGSGWKTFFCGRFRYGVSVYPGFHFDVSPANGSTIQCNLRRASGEVRVMRGERRGHVNIFPNDYILPER